MQKIPAAKPWALTFMPESLHQPQSSLRCPEEEESDAAKEFGGQVSLGRAAQRKVWPQDAWGMQENILEPPVEGFGDSPSPEHLQQCPCADSAVSQRAETPLWVTTTTTKCFPLSSPNDVPSVCVCVCPFLPWEIWYQASAGMAHLFREGFFLKWPCSVKNSLWRGSWVEIFLLHGGNVCVCESIIGLAYSQLKV